MKTMETSKIRGVSLFEIVISIGILAMMILYVTPLCVLALRGSRADMGSHSLPVILAAGKLEEMKAFANSTDMINNIHYYPYLKQEFDNKKFYYTYNGSATGNKDEAYFVVKTGVSGNNLPSSCRKRCWEAQATVYYNANGQKAVRMVVLIAPPPPPVYMIISGFLPYEGEESPVYGDEYWGGFYGYRYGMMQGYSYAEGTLPCPPYPVSKPYYPLPPVPPPYCVPVPWPSPTGNLP
ncbi:MAG: hypothetical protein J7M18_06560 [Candidatus Eremiobacteraeota bacterium]|nr:hypothetical protein [Candidatus Eremiobacteraeota bacterium]